MSPPLRSLPHARWATNAIFFANGLGIGAWAAAIPGLKLRFALTDASLSMVLLAFAAGAVLSMPLVGGLAARVGPQRLTVGSALMFACALALPPHAGNLATLSAMAFALGFVNGWVDVSMNAMASGVERKWGAAIMSSFHAAFSVGGLVGAGCGVLVGVSAFGGLLTCAAGVGVVITIAAARYLDSTERYEKSAATKWQTPSSAAVALCLVAALCMMVEGAMADWSGVFLMHLGTANAPAIGFAAFSLTMTAGRLAGDRIVRALGPAAVVRAGGALSALGLGCAAMAHHPAVAAIGFAMVGLGLANIVPCVFSAAAKVGRNPAAGVALAATVGYSGFLAGPPLVGLISTLTGLRSAFVVLALAGALIFAVAWLAMRKTA